MITSPIPKPATALNAPRSSTAVAKTATTRKIVRIASIATPAPLPTEGCRSGAPSRAGAIASFGKIHHSSSDATTAPANCISQ